MKLLRFEGYSDDTFACTGPGIDVDLDTCASGAPLRRLLRPRGRGASSERSRLRH